MNYWKSLHKRAKEREEKLKKELQVASRKVLEEVDGYIIVDDYHKAIAAEIAFSKKIQNKGYEIVQIGEKRHSRIGHRQWMPDGFFPRLANSIKKRTMSYIR